MSQPFPRFLAAALLVLLIAQKRCFRPSAAAAVKPPIAE